MRETGLMKKRFPSRKHLGCSLLTGFWVMLLAAPATAQQWPQWRGPNGDSVSHEREVPVAWSETRGVRWKTPLPEWGTSTPIVWDDAIFLTSHAGEELLLLRIDKATGEIVWQQTVGTGTTPRGSHTRGSQVFHDLHNLATPSPVTDGERVVVHFGNGDLAAYDFDGNQLWKRNLQEDYGPYTNWWGHSNSPVLHDGLVISVCMQDSLDDLQEEPASSYVVAHNLADGQVRWHVPRMTGAVGEQGDSYTTPLLRRVDDRMQLIIMGGNQLDAYNPTTGHQIWFLPNLYDGRTVTSPTASDDMVYATRGMQGDLIAVEPGQGELNYRAIDWDNSIATADSVSPVLWNDLLFYVTDNGIASCYDIRAGNLQWRERMPGEYKASPVVAAGRVYFLNTTGVCTVVSAMRRYGMLTRNELDAQTIASPVVSRGVIILRSRDSLYCLGP